MSLILPPDFATCGDAIAFFESINIINYVKEF